MDPELPGIADVEVSPRALAPAEPGLIFPDDAN
jgi:hypothetical protein